MLQTWETSSNRHVAGKATNVTVASVGLAGAAVMESMDLMIGTATLVVNAAIMDGRNQPVNAPWMIELDL